MRKALVQVKNQTFRETPYFGPVYRPSPTQAGAQAFQNSSCPNMYRAWADPRLGLLEPTMG